MSENNQPQNGRKRANPLMEKAYADARRVPIIRVVRNFFPGLEIEGKAKGEQGEWKVKGVPGSEIMNVTCTGKKNAASFGFQKGKGTGFAGALDVFLFLSGIDPRSATPEQRTAALETILSTKLAGVKNYDREALRAEMAKQNAAALAARANEVARERPAERDLPPPSVIPGDDRRVRDYLVEERKIPSEIVDSAMEAGAIYPARFDPNAAQTQGLPRRDIETIKGASARARARGEKGLPEPIQDLIGRIPLCTVFKLRQYDTLKIVSYNKRSVGKEKFNRTYGPKGGFMIGSYGPNTPPPLALAITEAPIEAMSLVALLEEDFGPEVANHICVAGVCGASDFGMILDGAKKHGITRVISAMNNDVAGRDYAAKITALAKERGMEVATFIPPGEIEVKVAKSAKYEAMAQPLVAAVAAAGLPVDSALDETERWHTHRLPNTAAVCTLWHDLRAQKPGYLKVSAPEQGAPNVVAGYRDHLVKLLGECGVKTKLTPAATPSAEWVLAVEKAAVAPERRPALAGLGLDRLPEVSSFEVVKAWEHKLEGEAAVVEWRKRHQDKEPFAVKYMPLVDLKYTVSDWNDLLKVRRAGAMSPQLKASAELHPAPDLRKFLGLSAQQESAVAAEPAAETAVTPHQEDHMQV